MTNENSKNFLGTAPIGKTLAKFAIPAVIGNLISTIYNITDQVFIGQGIGTLGNSATTVAFPISIICTAIAILFGFGAAASINLEMGKGNKSKVSKIIGTTFFSLLLSGLLISAINGIFMNPIMKFFGATADNMSYVISYVSIINIGIPFLLISTGGAHLIRADGKPTYSMICVVIGAALNMILDPLFIFVFKWGISGAAWATVISQIVSMIYISAYIPRFQSAKLKIKDFIPNLSSLRLIIPLGFSVFINQIAILIQQISINNVLKTYGELSIYGSDTALAVMGIISKISMIVISVCLGIAQGGQPIMGYNYGTEKYSRVRQTFKYIIAVSFGFSCVAFLLFQTIPGPTISLFGAGDELYVEFAVKMMRIYLFFTFVNGVQPISANCFPAIGRSIKGVFMALIRPLVFLIPLFLLPKAIGIDGVGYAGLIADGVTFIFALIMWINEFRKMPKEIIGENA